MGLTYANIELVNGEDVTLQRRNYISEDEVRQVEVSMLVDSGSIMLAINEEMDLWVNPARGVLTPIHPDGPIMTLKGVRAVAHKKEYLFKQLHQKTLNP